jgi:hypothetical protein
MSISSTMSYGKHTRLLGILRIFVKRTFSTLLWNPFGVNGRLLLLVEIDPSPVRINSLIRQAKIFDNDALLV